MKTKRQAGAEIVEFALILPIFFALIFSVMQIGWLLYSYVVLTTAAATGARVFATQRGYSAPYTDTTNAVLSAAAILAPSANVQASLTINMAVNGTACQSDTSCISALGTAKSAPAAGTQASVSLNYAFTPIFGNWFGLLPSKLQATMSELLQ